jgi:hypothetical protein
MKPNIGRNDRILRLISGVLTCFLGIYFSSGFLVIAGLFTLFEALSSWCVFYQIIGKNTCPANYSNKEKSLPFLKILIGGWLILFTAIILNTLSDSIGWTTWHDVLKNGMLPKSIDNIVFLLVIYPFSLSLSFWYLGKIKL